MKLAKQILEMSDKTDEGYIDSVIGIGAKIKGEDIVLAINDFEVILGASLGLKETGELRNMEKLVKKLDSDLGKVFSDFFKKADKIWEKS